MTPEALARLIAQKVNGALMSGIEKSEDRRVVGIERPGNRKIIVHLNDGQVFTVTVTDGRV